MKKAVFFDLDGTLLDTLDALYTSVKKVFKKNNLKVPTKQSLSDATGNGARRQMDILLKGYDNQFIEKILEEYVEDYNQNYTQKTTIFTNIISLLKILKKNNIKMAIISNKPDPIVKKLHQLFFSEYIDFAIGQSEEFKIKPDFAMIKKTMEVMEIDNKEDILYVGDSEVDILTGFNNDIDYVACSYGFRTYEKLLEYTDKNHIVKTSKELKEYIIRKCLK